MSIVGCHCPVCSCDINHPSSTHGTVLLLSFIYHNNLHKSSDWLILDYSFRTLFSVLCSISDELGLKLHFKLIIMLALKLNN